MDEQIRQIAERLRGLRDVLELTADDPAADHRMRHLRKARTQEGRSCHA